LRFEHPNATIELQVSVSDDATLVHGDFTETGDVRVVLHMRDHDQAVVSEVQEGGFDFGPLDHGLVRISVAPYQPNGAGDHIWTDWFRI
jgi:hypothetical protein